MPTRITQNLYTCGRFRWDGKKHYYETNDDGFLYSKGRYLTGIRECDLPEWFVRGYVYHQYGYVSSKRIRDLQYCCSHFTNHIFKDDLLYVSYNNPIPQNIHGELLNANEYDEVISGWMIVRFINAVDKHSTFDTTPIKRQINEKLTWYQNNWDVYREVPADMKYIFNLE